MNEKLRGMALGEPATVNQILSSGCVVLLTDGRVLTVPTKEARVTKVWSPATRLEIWRDSPDASFPLCVRNTLKDEEVHGRWEPRRLTPG